MNTGAPWPTAEQAEARVLEIQAKLHRWATDDPDRRFADLFNCGRLVRRAWTCYRWQGRPRRRP